MFNIKNFLNLNYYISELDKFLARYAEKHPKMTPSQQEEFDKYQHISQLRDKKTD